MLAPGEMCFAGVGAVEKGFLLSFQIQFIPRLLYNTLNNPVKLNDSFALWYMYILYMRCRSMCLLL